MVAISVLIEGWFLIFGVSTAITLGALFIRKSRKLDLNLLTIAAFVVILSSFYYVGIIVDFISILLTGHNMYNPWGLHGIITFIMVFPALLCAMYIGAKLLFPEKVKHILVIYLVLGIVFELFLLLNPLGAIEFVYPTTPGESLIDVNIIMFSPAFFLVLIFIFSVLILNGFGFLYKSFQVSGALKRKYLILSIGFILFFISASCEAFLNLYLFSFFIRIGMVTAALFLYYGLKTT